MATSFYASNDTDNINEYWGYDHLTGNEHSKDNIYTQ
jgi:hypothetical protein